MQSRHLVLGRSLGIFPVGIASRICLVNLSEDILDSWPNQLSWDLLYLEKKSLDIRDFINFAAAHLPQSVTL